MVQLLEVVLIEIGEEPGAADRMPGDLEIVDVVIPVVANGGIVGGHRGWRRLLPTIRYLAMRPRDPAALADGVHDMLVVGGGIYGLAIAADAASRGLSVALVEADDFGAATSFNHQRTVHGGLRSLQTRPDRSRARVDSRTRALARMAPRLLRTLPFIVGTYRSWLEEPRSRCARRSGSTGGSGGIATTASSRSCICREPRLSRAPRR